LAEVDQARRSLVATAAGRKGQLRVALCDGLAHPRIAQLLAVSRREDPEVELRITHSSFRAQLRELRAGILDVALALQPSADPELCSVPLWKDAVVVVIRPEHALATEPTVKSIGPTAGPAILMGERSDEAFEYVSSLELLLTLVASGGGIGLISAAQAETIHRSDLVIRPLSIRGATITTFLLRRREDTSKLVTRFMERAQKMV
jgi:DNA-binding transcriptional LysR family regulator